MSLGSTYWYWPEVGASGDLSSRPSSCLSSRPPSVGTTREAWDVMVLRMTGREVLALSEDSQEDRKAEQEGLQSDTMRKKERWREEGEKEERKAS